MRTHRIITVLFAVLIALSAESLLSGCSEKAENAIPASGIAIEPQEIELSPGETFRLTITVTPENATDTIVNWSSDHPEIASVDAGGTVTAISFGEAVITAVTSEDGLTATCNVTVRFETDYPGELVRIKAGSFMMGSPETDPHRQNNELPQHEVTITKDFYMSACEVTNTQYAAFLNETGVGQDGTGTLTYTDLITGQEKTVTEILIADSYDENITGAENDVWGCGWNGSEWEPAEGFENCPVVFVSWFGAMAYAQYYGASLPTGAQWEYACRAGSDTPWFFGNSSDQMSSYAWYRDNSDGHPNPVGTKEPNQWGLYDIYGNVWEWCRDYNGYYSEEPVTDPVNTGENEFGYEYEMRGGSWYFTAGTIRSALRWSHADWRYFNQVGFRIVYNVE